MPPPPRSTSAPPMLAPGERAIVGTTIGFAWVLLFCGWFFTRDLPNSGATPVNRATLAGLLPELLAANFVSSPESGWRYFPQRLDLLATAGGMLLGTWGLGRCVLRGLRLLPGLSGAEGLALAGGVGLSLWSLITLGLGWVGLLARPLFILLLAMGGVAGLATLRSTSAVSRTALLPTASPALRWTALGICAPFVLAMLLGAMLPPTDFDVKEYHLQGPKEYWQNGCVTFLPHNVYTSFPFLTEMLSLSAMVVRGDWYRGALAGQVVLMSFAILSACGVWGAAQRLLAKAERPGDSGETTDLVPSTAAWFGAVVFLSTPWVYRLSIIAYVEGGLACYVILTVLAFLITRRDGETTNQQVWLTGLLAGSAAACKYPGVLSVAIPVGAAVLVRAARAPRSGEPRWRAAAIDGLFYAVGVLVAFGPWLAKNLRETGNPVYPLLWSFFGGASFDAETNLRWTAAHAPPDHLWQHPAAILPDLWERLLDVAGRSDWQSPLAFGLMPLLLLASQRRRFLPLAGYGAWMFLTWCWLTHRIDRFWVPMLPVLALLSGAGGAALAARLRQWRESTVTLGPWLLTGLWGLVLTSLLLFNLAFITTGLCGFSGYLLDEAVARRIAAGQAVTLLESAGLQQQGKALFVGEAAVFDADFPCLYNTVFDDSIFEQWCAAPVEGRPRDEWGLRPAEEIHRTFTTEGVTHVCVHWKEILRYRLPGSYGFTDFVHPRRFEALCAAGVLRRTPFVASIAWSDLSPPEREEIDRWAPELHLRHGGEEFLRSIEVYEVVPPPAVTP
jgi:hypothetical protein